MVNIICGAKKNIFCINLIICIVYKNIKCIYLFNSFFLKKNDVFCLMWMEKCLDIIN